MRLVPRTMDGVLTRAWALLLLPALLPACGVGGAPPQNAGSAAPATTSSAAATVAQAPEPAPDPNAPPRPECETFMDVVHRMTTLRATIHREAASAPKAAEWAAQTTQLASDAKALRLSHPDLVIENANLATRMSDLAKDLRSLADAEKGSDPGKKAAAHKRVLNTSEQVEVITREPAARCAGTVKRLIATSGHLPAAVISDTINARLPLAQKCYEAGLKRDPKLAGRVLVRLVIGPDGKVSEAAPATAADARSADAITPGDAQIPAMPDEKVTACVVDVLRQTVFPAPDGGSVSVVYPVTFARTQ